MNLLPPNIRQLVRKLFAQIGSTGKDAEVAQEKLKQLLSGHGLSWNDLPRILVADVDADGDVRDVGTGDGAPAAAAPTEDEIPNLLGLVLALLEEHAATTAEHRLAIALWILHCWVFERFTVTPRLALLSPVRGCGKTTLLGLIELLIPEGNRTDNTTAAAIYHDLDTHPRAVLLIDEADGLNLAHDNVLRSVFNSGHRRGGSINRFVGGRPQRYRTFAPLAIAAIGMLPLPLLHRSVLISMQRSSAQLKRLDEGSLVFRLARNGIQKWSASVQLARTLKCHPHYVTAPPIIGEC